MVITYHTVIDVQQHIIFCCTVKLRLHDIAFYLIILITSIQRNRTLRTVSSINLHKYFQKITAALGFKNRSTIMRQAESDFRMGKGKLLNYIRNKRKFILRTFQMLEACRCFLKQILNFYHGSLRSPAWSGTDQLAVVDLHLGRGCAVICSQQYMRNRCDGRQCLPAKSHCMYIPEIINLFQLACGMPLKCQRGILRIHTVTIIYNRNGRNTTL